MTKKKKVVVAVGPKNARAGEDHHHAKIPDAHVEMMRDLYELEDEHGEKRYGYKRLAKEFGVPLRTVRDIVNYRRRACTPDSYRTVDAEGDARPFATPDDFETLRD